MFYLSITCIWQGFTLVCTSVLPMFYSVIFQKFYVQSYIMLASSTVREVNAHATNHIPEFNARVADHVPEHKCTCSWPRSWT